MGWEDRDYNRDDSGGPPGDRSPLMWVLYGSVPLFRAFGIRVRMHASLVIFIILTLLFGLGAEHMSLKNRLISMGGLFLIVLLHEFGHCFGARWVGGGADLIVMHPLGGLAFTRPPHRPMAHFLTTAAGPFVNVLICLVAGIFLYFVLGWVPWNPMAIKRMPDAASWLSFWPYVWWIYYMSQMLFLFNLIPCFPLDGGRMVQELLWMKMGYYRSMKLSTEIGIVGAVIIGIWALGSGMTGLVVLAILGAITCFQMRKQLLAAGPGAFDDERYAAAYETFKPKKKSWMEKRREQAAAQSQQDEQAEIDRILDKVRDGGMQSLTRGEKKFLAQATEKQRQRDAVKPRGKF